jgi:hypothetical protein
MMKKTHPAEQILAYLDDEETFERNLAAVEADPDFQLLCKMDAIQLGQIIKPKLAPSSTEQNSAKGSNDQDEILGDQSHRKLLAQRNVAIWTAIAATLLFVAQSVVAFSTIMRSDSRIDALSANVNDVAARFGNSAANDKRLALLESHLSDMKSELKHLGQRIVVLERRRERSSAYGFNLESGPFMLGAAYYPASAAYYPTSFDLYVADNLDWMDWLGVAAYDCNWTNAGGINATESFLPPDICRKLTDPRYESVAAMWKASILLLQKPMTVGLSPRK